MVSLAKRMHNVGNSVVFSKLLFVYGVIVILTGAFIFGIVLVQVIVDLQSNEDNGLLCK
jgi:hypothetical protein